MKHILSYGAGINSTALMILLIKQKIPFREAIFADTGGELPETYETLKIAEAYLKEHGIPLIIVKSKKSTLYETCIRRKVTPSQIWRWSTRDYKITPIHAYYRSLDVNIIQYLGIAYDEKRRAKPSKVPYITNIFPLVEQKITRQDCIQIIQEADLPPAVKSGCWFCPFNNEERWYYIWKHHRKKFLEAMKLEETSKHFPKQKLHKLTLRELAKKFRRMKKQN